MFEFTIFVVVLTYLFTGGRYRLCLILVFYGLMLVTCNTFYCQGLVDLRGTAQQSISSHPVPGTNKGREGSLTNSLSLYNFSCFSNSKQSFEYPFYKPLSLTTKIMLFKRPGRRHLLLDEGCMEPGCLYIRLPPILHSLYIEGVIWPLAGVSEGIIELDPQSIQHQQLPKKVLYTSMPY